MRSKVEGKKETERKKERMNKRVEQGVGRLAVTDSRGDIERVEIAINQTNATADSPLQERKEGRERGGEKEPGEEKARSVVTSDDNLSGRSGSLRDSDTQRSRPST